MRKKTREQVEQIFHDLHVKAHPDVSERAVAGPNEDRVEAIAAHYENALEHGKNGRWERAWDHTEAARRLMEEF